MIREIGRWFVIILIVAAISVAAGYGCSAIMNIGNDSGNVKTDDESVYKSLQDQYENDSDFKKEFDQGFEEGKEDLESYDIKYKIKKNTIVFTMNVGDYPATEENEGILADNVEANAENSNNLVNEMRKAYGYKIKMKYRYINTDGDLIYQRTFNGK